MSSLKPSLKLIRVLAGEGDFHLYRLLRERPLFLFAKCLLTTLAYFRGSGSKTESRIVAFVKGPNQARYYQHAHEQLTAHFGELQLYESAPPTKQPEARLLPRFSIRAVIHQVGWLLLMLITGKHRYLNLYLMRFAESVCYAVDNGMPHVEAFVCFNDQPYDVAAIVFALNQRKNCRTIVIQHGLVLSPNFYFPTVAREFWAWGELSRQHYRAWDKDARFIVKGRYIVDASNKADDVIWPPQDRPIRILVAPSHFHSEVKHILTELDLAMNAELKATAQVAIKFHPATKMLWKLRLWCQQNAPWLKEEREPMETLATQYDVLLTKNSTSAVDFLLRGKPSFFVNCLIGCNFPSLSYGFQASEIVRDICNRSSYQSTKNLKRLNFIRKAINV